jgi:hypothetical protein
MALYESKSRSPDLSAENVKRYTGVFSDIIGRAFSIFAHREVDSLERLCMHIAENIEPEISSLSDGEALFVKAFLNYQRSLSHLYSVIKPDSRFSPDYIATREDACRAAFLEFEKHYRDACSIYGISEWNDLWIPHLS